MGWVGGGRKTGIHTRNAGKSMNGAIKMDGKKRSQYLKRGKAPDMLGGEPRGQQLESTSCIKDLKKGAQLGH